MSDQGDDNSDDFDARALEKYQRRRAERQQQVDEALAAAFSGLIHDPDRPVNLTQQSGTALVSNKIAELHTYEVLEDDLENIDSIVSDENQALGFSTFCLGTLISMVATLATTDPTGTALSILISLSAISAIGSAWTGITYFRRRKARKKLVTKIKERCLRR